MPRSPKYSLEPLLQHRERKVDEATAGLGDAVRAVESAEEAKARAERARHEEEERAARQRAVEAERLANGELRAGDLANAQRWEVGVTHAIADLERACDQARTRVTAARSAAEGARAELARQKADLDVVAKDRARFVDAARRAAEAAEEENAEEAHNGRRRDP